MTSRSPIHGASFYKVHVLADVTVLEIGVELEGGGGGGVSIFCGKTQWPIKWVIYCEICTDQKQQFKHDLSQQITTNEISAAWQFLSALCVCKVHKGSVTDSTQKHADRLCKINAPLAKLNHPCKWPLN